ncbi:uncharacterized protein LOC108909595 [Anoplophora glabripennis]|uniref:Protein TsetseEP domain-containing protein n=1 Tax=Anoplophora glabripennis TaxID=217634 RepID=V5GX40_ANOGL|nr:uncharacterized protein LOC108909595 [Anoplophora glabripennis]
MKLTTFLIPLLCLECALLVSSQTLSELVYELITTNENEKTASVKKLSEQYDQTKTEINNLLNRITIPYMNVMYEDLENYIEKLKTDTTSAGYDPTDCLTATKEHLESNSITKILDKALVEMSTVYEEIASNIHFTGTYNLQVIANEVNTIATDFSICVSSEYPEYCNKTLSTKVIAKQDQIPVLFNKEVERTSVALTQLVVEYENRIQDYQQEAVAVTKPYLALLESCISVVLTK